jgi:hypothetical protein
MIIDRFSKQEKSITKFQKLISAIICKYRSYLIYQKKSINGHRVKYLQVGRGVQSEDDQRKDPET